VFQLRKTNKKFGTTNFLAQNVILSQDPTAYETEKKNSSPL
jgi:hypothetical protein